jgi:hypothetical protein
MGSSASVCACATWFVCACVYIYCPCDTPCCNRNITEVTTTTHRVTIGCMYILHLGAFFILNAPRPASKPDTRTHLGTRTTPRTIPAHPWSGPHRTHLGARPTPALVPCDTICCKQNTTEVATRTHTKLQLAHFLQRICCTHPGCNWLLSSCNWPNSSCNWIASGCNYIRSSCTGSDLL